MDVFARPMDVRPLVHSNAARDALADVVVLGMPHLCLSGLSETWLLKECGHRHWYLLAQAAGFDRPNFRDAEGEPIYAAFVSVSLRDARLDLAREHDELAFSSRLTRVSRTQVMSIHRLAIGCRIIGTVAMTSTFVRRSERGNNHSSARVDVAGLPPVGRDATAAAYTAEAGELRSNSWLSHLGLTRSEARIMQRFLVDPCPGQDFNGADFLYFASFQAFVDRAEWDFFHPRQPFPTTRRRDIIYRGNINPGERVVVSLLQVRGDRETLVHWYRLGREQDGRVIADAFTVRA
jgi:probable biosynthetic protein (TIGR04099 family)